MNERIQKLYDQADKFAKENCTQTISGPGNNYFELFHEKFAELIVRNCVYMVKGYECALNRDNQLSSAMLEHFGVEE